MRPSQGRIWGCCQASTSTCPSRKKQPQARKYSITAPVRMLHTPNSTYQRHARGASCMRMMQYHSIGTKQA